MANAAHPRTARAAAACVTALVLLPLAGYGVLSASKNTLTSGWRDRDIKIDGFNDDWPTLSSFSEDTRFSIGLANDEQFLYVALSTNDRATSLQALHQGLIVWFDAEGGKKKRFGIEYPVVALPEARSDGYGGGRGRGGYGGGERQDGSDGQNGGQGKAQGQPSVDELWARAQANGRLNQLELLGPGKDDRRSLVVAEAAPIQVKIGTNEGTLVYEMRIPLTKSGDAPYAIGGRPGGTIGIGLETPPREWRNEGGRGAGGFGGMGGRGGFGGHGGWGGGGRPGYGGGPFFQRPQQAKPLKTWASVQLAAHAGTH